VTRHDVIVIGAGPAGSTCAAICSRSGMNVLLVDAARFPRDKVCGDCINPSAWPVLDSLGVAPAILKTPSSSPKIVRFSVADHHGSVEIPLPASTSAQGEFVIRRREFDALLAERAVQLGTIFQDGSPVTALEKNESEWIITTSTGMRARAPRIVAADGRNSAVCRHLRFKAPFTDRRIGIQTHLPHPPGYDGALEMRLYRSGYGGLADLGNGLSNLCLVANTGSIEELRAEVISHYGIKAPVAWRGITPISKSPTETTARDGVFFCGDAARVVEPFTGEGISLALRGAYLLGGILSEHALTLSGSNDAERAYSRAHRQLYNTGLWVNRLTRFLSEHPRMAHLLGPLILKNPGLLALMTRKVTGDRVKS